MPDKSRFPTLPLSLKGSFFQAVCVKSSSFSSLLMSGKPFVVCLTCSERVEYGFLWPNSLSAITSLLCIEVFKGRFEIWKSSGLDYSLNSVRIVSSI